MLRTSAHASIARLLLLLAILSFTLGCITTTMSFQVTHKWTPASERKVYVEIDQQLAEGWAQELAEANRDILATCASSPTPCSANPRLPETFDEVAAAMGMSGDMTSLAESGYVRTDWQNGRKFTRSYTLEEYTRLTTGAITQTTTVPTITITFDPSSGDTHYVMELAMAGQSSSTTEEPDWAAWDAARREPDPPKPPIQAPVESPEIKAEGEAGRALALTGMGSLLGGILGAAGEVLTTPESALKEWHQARIFKKLGFPTLFRFRFLLPGDIISHTMNGQPAGEIVEDTEVLFSIDEAFLRKNGFQGPWTFRAESVVTREIERAASDEALDSTEKSEPAAPATDETQPTVPAEGEKESGPRRYYRFRIRQTASYSLGLFVGFVYTTYQLQEMEPDGTPGRTCRIRFLGFGPAANAGFMPDWAVFGFAANSAGDWTEMELNPGKPPMRLEDFDGVKGYHSDAGMFVESWSGAIFCTRESATDQVARTQGAGPQVGFYAGADSAVGTWVLIGTPK